MNRSYRSSDKIKQIVASAKSKILGAKIHSGRKAQELMDGLQIDLDNLEEKWESVSGEISELFKPEDLSDPNLADAWNAVHDSFGDMREVFNDFSKEIFRAGATPDERFEMQNYDPFTD